MCLSRSRAGDVMCRGTTPQSAPGTLAPTSSSACASLKPRPLDRFSYTFTSFLTEGDWCRGRQVTVLLSKIHPLSGQEASGYLVCLGLHDNTEGLMFGYSGSCMETCLFTEAGEPGDFLGASN